MKPSSLPRLAVPACRWPLPAVLAWAAAWAVALAAGAAGLPVVAGLALGTAVGALLSLLARSPARRGWVMAGFPASALALHAAGALPPWAWLAAAAALAAAYPLRAWRDAPFFPTPPGALGAVAAHAPLPPGAAVLDAGCGIGHGLAELHRAYPQAAVHGVEWSAPLALAARWRCRRFATVTRGDLWAASWRPYALVYLFQRPESMARAAAKARAEMAEGSWLASLEFPVPELVPTHRLDAGSGRPLWLYRIGGPPAGAPPEAGPRSTPPRRRR